MTGVTFDMAEVEVLANDVSQAGSRITDAAAQVVAKSAFDIESTAKMLAPVDTGYLRSSIHADISGLSATIGPSAHYGIYVEFGTSRGAPQQPFLFPALDRHEQSFLDAMGKAAAGAFK